MRKLNLSNGKIITSIVLAFLVVVFSAILVSLQIGEELQVGARYKIVQPVYIMGIYDSLDNRTLSADTATAYLHSRRYYDKSYVAFQTEVPIGTNMTIIGSVSKIWHIPFFASRYSVKLDPDPSKGLDVVLELNRGMSGDSDGLNSELFSRVKN